MQKEQGFMRRIFDSVGLIVAAIFLVWRAETYTDVRGHQLMLPRLMCFTLAILIVVIAAIRGLEALPDHNA